ncbi:MAG: carbonic anhydrase [Candidatus Reconcilbacillus cellulovorans]|uniref:carbonic anhydrase n=1 Tax=Candidatus Reconcilbacillus cellulovorans TaxID=1906605 RepID=A0A2A6E3B9_9BACL|nr:MAG: carbonic anhydrase [Candidatus Reconcilbacillus cellulovorans]
MKEQPKTVLDEILSHNREFVRSKAYEAYRTTKFPDKKMVVVTCMDTRLTELLPKAMNLRNGDAKIIKVAGAIVLQPFGNVMRSVIVAIYALGAQEVFVVGHRDCGMTGLDPNAILSKAKACGVREEVFETIRNSGIDLARWLHGFRDVHEGVRESVGIIRRHPLLPPGVPVHGLVIDPETGELELVEEGYGVLA